jgi:hypothetical protein
MNGRRTERRAREPSSAPQDAERDGRPSPSVAVSSPPDVIALQATAGNQAVTSMLQRQPRKPDPAARAQADAAEEVWTSLLAFSARATPEMSKVKRNVTSYLKRYDAAWGEFAGRLSKSQQQAAAREKWADVMKGIVIGVGVGLASGGLYTAVTLVGKVAYEAAGEGAEAAIGGAAGGASAVDFTPPAELQNDKVARGHLEKLLEAFEALTLIQAASLAFSRRRDQLRDAANGVEPAKGALPPATNLQADLRRLKTALAAADQALTTFLTTASNPVIDRDQKSLEQDLWIKWVSQKEAHAGVALDDDDAAGARMQELGIFSRLVRDREPFNAEALTGYAREEKGRLEKLGRLGVVVVPPRPNTGRGDLQMGAVRLRRDAYPAAGRTDPQQPDAGEYVKVAWEARTYLRPGEVVMIKGTTNAGMTVERVGPALPVGEDERKAAEGMLGLRKGEYEAEAVAALGGSVGSAVAWGMKDEPPPLKLTHSEDGVLVSEEDGTKLILFGPHSDLDWTALKARKQRTGAPKIVAIEIAGGRKVDEWRQADLVVTGRTDHEFIRQEIRAARKAAAAARQPTAAK